MFDVFWSLIPTRSKLRVRTHHTSFSDTGMLFVAFFEFFIRCLDLSSRSGLHHPTYSNRILLELRARVEHLVTAKIWTYI